MDHNKLWEEIQKKKLFLDNLINNEASLTEEFIIKTSKELDELINEYYDSI